MSSAPDLDDAQWSSRALELIERAHDAGMTYTQIADAVDRSDPTIHHWRAAARVPRDPKIMAALQGLDPTDRDDLCGAAGCTQPSTSMWCPRHREIVTQVARRLRDVGRGAASSTIAEQAVARHGDNVADLAPSRLQLEPEVPA